MRGHYKLGKDRKTPVSCGLMEWARAIEKDRVVSKDELSGGVLVSTVFLGLDHSFGSGPPILFETMIFGGPHDGYQERYSSWDEAEKGHKKALAKVGTK